MKLRKFNAVLSLVTTALLLDHSIFFSVWMLSRCKIEKSAEFMPYILAVLMIIHAVICIAFGILSGKGEEKRKCNSYAKMNISTYIQRFTGILMILMLAIHIAGSFNHFQPKIFHAIMHPLFFAVVLLHISVSTSKAFITLGIGNARFIKVVDIGMKIICAGIFIAALVGFYICLFVGVEK